MKISDIYKSKAQPISFEIFPPKGDFDIDSLKAVLDGLCSLAPDFISVTYSAGGSGNGKNTLALTSVVKNDYGIETIAHLTCINSDKKEVADFITRLKENNIQNVLALRGDRVEGKTTTDFKYAKDLIPSLKDAGFCVGAGCYPEGHIECDSLELDIEHLVEKEAAGADFFLSQLFFSNDVFYRFLEKARRAGITRPIVPGIMPFLSKAQISRMIFMCGASLPAEIIRLLNKYADNEDDLKKAGMEYAANQTVDLLAHGTDGVHIYTMNQPQIARVQLDKIHHELNL